MEVSDLYRVYGLIRHFEALRDLFNGRRLYEHLGGIGSDLGVLMIDRFKDGYAFAYGLKHKFGAEMQKFSERTAAGKMPY